MLTVTKTDDTYTVTLNICHLVFTGRSTDVSDACGRLGAQIATRLVDNNISVIRFLDNCRNSEEMAECIDLMENFCKVMTNRGFRIDFVLRNPERSGNLNVRYDPANPEELLSALQYKGYIIAVMRLWTYANHSFAQIGYFPEDNYAGARISVTLRDEGEEVTSVFAHTVQDVREEITKGIMCLALDKFVAA